MIDLCNASCAQHAIWNLISSLRRRNASVSAHPRSRLLCLEQRSGGFLLYVQSCGPP